MAMLFSPIACEALEPVLTEMMAFPTSLFFPLFASTMVLQLGSKLTFAFSQLLVLRFPQTTCSLADT